MKAKKVSYKGVKAELPANVSIKTFKEVVNICNGFGLVQQILDLISRKLYTHGKSIL